MPRILTAAALAATYTARFAQPGTVDLSAAGGVVFPSDSSSLDTVQAAGVRSFTAPGKQVFVKVVSHFLVGGETVCPGEYVELPEAEAKQVVNAGRAQIATDDEVAAAQKQPKAGK